jgi:hypothetical protein
MKNRTIEALVKVGTIVGVSAISTTGCGGTGAGGICQALGDCGGDPTGDWKVVSTCSNPVSLRPVQNFAPPETTVPTPPTPSGSWCWDLSLNPDGTLISPATPVPNPTVVDSGTVSFKPDQTYGYALNASSRTAMHIARSCLGVNGANLTCDGLAANMQAFIGANPLYQNFACTPAPPSSDGCDCIFDYVETQQSGVGDEGRWVVEGNRIHHYSKLFSIATTFRSVREATFCVSDNGQKLELTGSRGTTLALKAGLRTLTLTKM